MWKDDLKTAWESGKIVYEADLDKLIDNINSIDTTSSPGITQSVNATDGSITLSSQKHEMCANGAPYSLIGDTSSSIFLYILTQANLLVSQYIGTYNSATNLTTYYVTPAPNQRVISSTQNTTTFGVLPIFSDIISLISYIIPTDEDITLYTDDAVGNILTNPNPHSYGTFTPTLSSGISLIDSSGNLSTTGIAHWSRNMNNYTPVLSFTGSGDSVSFNNSSGGAISLTANTPYLLSTMLTTNIPTVSTKLRSTERFFATTVFMDDTFTTVTGVATLMYFNSNIYVIVENNYSWGQNDNLLFDNRIVCTLA
jgi:hypothetical protein